MSEQYEEGPDGFGRDGTDGGDYPYMRDRRYIPHPVAPVGTSAVEELAFNRGTPDPEGDPDQVGPGEMAYLVGGRQNASTVLVDQGKLIGPLTASCVASHEQAEAELDRLARARSEAEGATRRAARELRALEDRFSHVPPERKQPPNLLLKVVMVSAIIAFAVLDMWFFHTFVVYYWRLSPETDTFQSMVIGPLLGLLVALLVWVSGLLLGRQIWYLRADADPERERPGETDADGNLRPWYSRVPRAARWRVGRAARRSVPTLFALVLAAWTLTVVGWFGFYRALDDVGAVPPIAVAILILTLGLGAMILEAVAHNPYVASVRSARRPAEDARRGFEAAYERAVTHVSEAAQYWEGLRRHRGEAMELARIESDRAWGTVIMPARHKSGRSGPTAPNPRMSAGSLSDDPGAEELDAFFNTFAGIRQPTPGLGSLHGANSCLGERTPEALRARLRELAGPLPQVEELMPEQREDEGPAPDTVSEPAAADRTDTEVRP